MNEGVYIHGDEWEYLYIISCKYSTEPHTESVLHWIDSGLPLLGILREFLVSLNEKAYNPASSRLVRVAANPVNTITIDTQDSRRLPLNSCEI